MISIPKPLPVPASIALHQLRRDGIAYQDLERIESVSTVRLGTAEFKIVGHKDVPDGEVHLVSSGRLVAKLVNSGD